MNDPIVIDFEGFADARPLLAGVLVAGAADGGAHGEFRQFVFAEQDERMRVAAEAKNLAVTTLREFCIGLVDRARREKRAIVGFSTHEREEIAKALGGAWPDDVEYIDAKNLAKTWRRAVHPAEEARLKRVRKRKSAREEFGASQFGNRLVDLERLSGGAIPATYGDRRVTARLRVMLEQLGRKREYALLSPGAKRGWSNLLAHNRFDCESAARMSKLSVSARNAA